MKFIASKTKVAVTKSCYFNVESYPTDFTLALRASKPTSPKPKITKLEGSGISTEFKLAKSPLNTAHAYLLLDCFNTPPCVCMINVGFIYTIFSKAYACPTVLTFNISKADTVKV